MSEPTHCLLSSIVPPGQVPVAMISGILVILCVLLHYEVLRKLSTVLARLVRLHRLRVLVLMIGLLVTHTVEIWIYSAAYGFLNGHDDFGHLELVVTHADAGWLDCVYFSFVTYTTLGYGDIMPVGPIRFIAATEALNGWMLLGWSASFTFLEMQRFWRDPKGKNSERRAKK